jgi:hypothetical protein
VNLVFGVQSSILLVLAVASLALTGFAALDSLRHGQNQYRAVGRQTKVFWVAILAVGFLLSIVSITDPLRFYNLIAVVAAGVYLADQRPKLKQVKGGRGSSGPYGPY